MGEKLAIIKTENHAIVAGGEGLTGFFLPGELDTAFRENNWNVAEMVEVLTSIIRDTSVRHTEKRDGSIVEEPVTTARERMAAISMLDKKAKEGLILGGLIVKDRLTARKTTEDGTEMEYNAEGMRLVKEGSSRLKSTLALLEDASKAGGDEVIDVEVSGGDKRGNAKLRKRDEGGDGSNRRGSSKRSLLPRQPRGSDSDSGPGGSGADGGPDCHSSGGDGLFKPLHDVERSDASDTHRQGPDDDEGPIKGAEDERGSGIPVQSGRSRKDQGVGGQSDEHRDGDQPNPVAPTREGNPTGTAESSLDRLKRMERAREQAAKAAAGYLERRAKNQRARRHVSGDPNEPRSGDGPDATPDSG